MTESATTWVCTRCGAEYVEGFPKDDRWRSSWEAGVKAAVAVDHKCLDADPNAGHFAAKKREPGMAR